MTPEDIKQLLKKAPFKPFALFMSNNERHPVTHPEMLIVGKSILALGIVSPIAAQSEETPLADYIIWLAPEHVVKIEPLETAKSQAR